VESSATTYLGHHPEGQHASESGDRLFEPEVAVVVHRNHRGVERYNKSRSSLRPSVYIACANQNRQTTGQETYINHQMIV